MSRIQPYDWQLKDQQALSDAGYVALCAIETGGGKSVSGALAIKNAKPEVTLIIAPQSTHETAWIPTVEDVAGLTPRVIGNSKKAHREAMTDFEWGYPGVYLVTPQLFTRSDVSDWAGDMLIVDEVHEIAAPGKKGQKNLSGYDINKDDPISKRFPMRIALSGTPLRNKFEYAWSLTRLLWPEKSRRGEIAHLNHYMWKFDRMESEEITTGFDREKKKRKTAKKWLHEAEPGRLFSEMPAVVQHFRRRRCCDAHPNGFLPLDEPQVIRRVVELSPKQKKAIQEMETYYMTWLDGNPLAAELTLTQQQRIRQMCLGVPTVTWSTDEEGNEHHTVTFDPDCESTFLDEFFTILEDLDEDEPVAVYMESQKFARVVTERLNKAGVPAFEFSGKVPNKERTENLRNFGKPGGHRVVVGVISSIGTGTDGIQKVCNTEVWFETSADPTLNEQAQARTDRMGAKKQVQRVVLMDSFGYAEGRMSKQLEERLKLRKSTTRKGGK